jgi:hypothetical protein
VVEVRPDILASLSIDSDQVPSAYGHLELFRNGILMADPIIGPTFAGTQLLGSRPFFSEFRSLGLTMLTYAWRGGTSIDCAADPDDEPSHRRPLLGRERARPCIKAAQ